MTSKLINSLFVSLLSLSKGSAVPLQTGAKPLLSRKELQPGPVEPLDWNGNLRAGRLDPKLGGIPVEQQIPDQHPTVTTQAVQPAATRTVISTHKDHIVSLAHDRRTVGAIRAGSSLPSLLSELRNALSPGGYVLFSLALRMSAAAELRGEYSRFAETGLTDQRTHDKLTFTRQPRLLPDDGAQGHNAAYSPNFRGGAVRYPRLVICGAESPSAATDSRQRQKMLLLCWAHDQRPFGPK